MKKITKKILLILIVTVLCFAVSMFASAETDGNYTYEVSNETATITDFDSSNTESNITIPLNLGGYEVTAIGNYAFYNCDNLESVTIPNSVISIGYQAFYHCNNLENIVIGDSVTTIGGGAFYWCDSLISVTLPDSVITIGESAFAGCYALKKVNLGNNLTTICNNAFAGCSDLVNVAIPKSVAVIDEYAFVYCRSLVEFMVDEDNQHYSSDKYGVLFDKEKSILLQYPVADTRTSYMIPDTVITIGISAFNGSYNLNSVTIPNSVTTIEEYSFFDCTNLTSITIGNGVKTIGVGAFLNVGLTDVYYLGTEKQWNNISIADYNEALIDANIHFLGDETHTHSYNKTINNPTCTTQGYSTYTCECGDSYVANRVDATGHKDNNSDYSCDNCDYEFERPTEPDKDNCSCNCHKGGFMGFIWKIINFFNKLFKSNKTCACGVTHY